MQSILVDYVYLVLIILGLVMLANRIGLAYPIVLVVGGLVISSLPFFRDITITPELVFLIFLPPLLYEAAWQVSWKEFWKWRRIIVSFAFLIVIVTACVIAFASSALIPEFTLALGFLLGGIISPPDSISSVSIMRQVRAPKSLISIAEGESLLNDASSLIVFRFALAAVITSQFHLQDAAFSFVLVVFAGALIGLAVGLVFYAIHRWLPMTPSIEIVLTFVTPYCMYYLAEHYHFSGVLAVVCGGLLLSSRRRDFLSYASRIQGVNVWNSIVFILNGLIFLLIGLQLPSIVGQLGDISLTEAIFYGLSISLILTITRVLLCLGASGFTRFMSNFITVAEVNPGWRLPIVLGWSGIRGVVSLAAALSIPLYINEGQPFPYRNLILFITFIVILTTMILNGLSLPWLIRKLDVRDFNESIPVHTQEVIIQKKLAVHSLEYLEAKGKGTGKQNKHLQNLIDRMKTELGYFEEELKGFRNSERRDYGTVYLELLQYQRELLDKINHQSEFDEELIRKYHALVDIEEFKTRESDPLEPGSIS
ncbi:Na+/H+ antiporter [Leptospira langatensis]|uniref:Na+/H+ antiporter n=1 Tax=Leptospira langatensis TaxID=2484983 RepID=A0A5F1ZX94_9LEPT|nr:Na+/H+ antiporter [Leptospira langatensis]TGJ98380.1 Na+/H+ antiporter [Leptospira langatensis]TGL43294.1 Na+/H+ antiporter [Leptospira langatensis]